jgi:hypothetical protein
MLCVGILRTEFGRRQSRAVTNAITQLAAEEELNSEPSLATPVWRERIRNWWLALRPQPALAFGTALVLVIGFAAWHLWSSGLVHFRTAPKEGFVCIMSDALNARWARDSKQPKTGDSLLTGPLRLESGVVELTFVSSAKVAIEGPAEFKLTSGNSLELQRGKISTDVPKRARGFTVSTPTARVVDLGTQFGASVNSDHASEVDVFQGFVELTAVANAENPGAKWRLSQDMAMIADGHGAVSATALSETALPQPNQTILARPQNCGFDVSGRAALGEVPRDFGYWSGPAYALTKAALGIQPTSGAGMLQFLNKPSDPAADSEVWQLIDMHPFKKQLASGLFEAKLSAIFNRIPGDGHAADKFGLTLAAFRGAPSDADSLWTRRKADALVLADKELATDDKPVTWEKVELSAKVPVETDFVIVEIRAIAPKQFTKDSPSFSGHFADVVDFKLCSSLRASSIAAGR